MSTARPLVVFADSASSQSVALLRAVLRSATRRNDLVVAAVCDSRRMPAGSYVLAAGRACTVPLVTRLFDPERHVVVRRAMVETLRGVARRAGVPVLEPPARDVNHRSFVERLQWEYGAPLGFSLLVAQVFRQPLLDVLERAVNFHPGRLPAYRGLVPTEWEVYRREPRAGVSFHLMTAGIDEGPLLVEDAVPISETVTVEQLAWQKVELGARLLDEALEALVGGAAGIQQHGDAGYFGRRELREVRAVGDPGALTWAELELRIRAFGALALRLAGQTYWVTRLRRLEGRSARASPYGFTTLDGICAEATRFRFLPLPLARLLRREYLAKRRTS